MDSLKNDATSMKEIRLQSQWKLFIQKNLNNISLDLLSHDKEKTYEVDLKEIIKVIERRIKIPEYLKQSEELLVRTVQEF